jgi:hypothetical protein
VSKGCCFSSFKGTKPSFPLPKIILPETSLDMLARDGEKFDCYLRNLFQMRLDWWFRENSACAILTGLWLLMCIWKLFSPASMLDAVIGAWSPSFNSVYSPHYSPPEAAADLTDDRSQYC